MQASGPPRSSRGFTLLEIMIVVTIIGFLAAMAMQTMQVVRNASRRNAAINDLRVFAGAFEQYATEQGVWPPDTLPGVFPAEMDGILSKNSWERRTPMGGNYDWDHSTGDVTAGISIRDTGGMFPTLEQLAELDRRLDDGNLNDGLVRLSAFGGIVYVLEP